MALPALAEDDPCPDPDQDPGASVRAIAPARARKRRGQGGSSDEGERARQGAIDELFTDADRHGPRTPELLARLALATAVLPLALLVSTSASSATHIVALGTWLAGMVVAGALLAPLARVRALPLVTASLLCLVPATALVATGWIVAATPLAATGALVIGLAAARFVSRAVWALPILLVAGVSDAQSVQGGFTDSLLAGADAGGAGAASMTWSIGPDAVTTLDFLVLHIPTESGLWILGLVDVVAIGLLLGLAHLYWQPLLRTAVALAVALALTVGIGTTVPVLPALGLAWAVANARLVWRSTRFSLRRLTYLGG